MARYEKTLIQKKEKLQNTITNCCHNTKFFIKFRNQLNHNEITYSVNEIKNDGRIVEKNIYGEKGERVFEYKVL